MRESAPLSDEHRRVVAGAVAYIMATQLRLTARGELAARLEERIQDYLGRENGRRRETSAAARRPQLVDEDGRGEGPPPGPADMTDPVIFAAARVGMAWARRSGRREIESADRGLMMALLQFFLDRSEA